MMWTWELAHNLQRRDVFCNPKEAHKVEAILVLLRITAIECVDRHEDAGPCPSRKVLIVDGGKSKWPRPIWLSNATIRATIGTKVVSLASRS